MKKVALLGAGGKMGRRITENLLHSPDYDTAYIEIESRGIEALKKRNVSVSSAESVVPDADIVVLAVPDIVIGRISEQIIPMMKPGALVLTLDPAAPLDGAICRRADLGYVIAHPCHPGIFNWEPAEADFRDFYGGVTAKQSIVVALMSGSETHYHDGEQLAEKMYGPVDRTHRVTLEQMAILEPAMVETLSQTCLEVVKEGFDRIVEMGVPAQAARDFVLGHLRIQIAVLFREVDGSFSDAAYKISRHAKPILFKENWQKIFDMDNIREQVQVITRP